MSGVWSTAERLLRVLAVLQRRPVTTAESLATDLGVTERTIRRDIGRLRDLGYAITAIRGAGGGYALGTGTALPPMLFDTDEAVAVLLALRDHAAGGDPETTDSSLRALDKIAEVLPARVASAITAMRTHSSHLDLGAVIGADPVPVDIGTLGLLARACRSRQHVTCTYRRGTGGQSDRQIEPLHLVRTMGRWYLVAYCLDALEWRTFRLDRMTDVILTTTPSRSRRPPAPDLHTYVGEQVGAAWRTVSATVRIEAPVDVVAPWVQPAWGTVRAESPTTTLVEAGADSYDSMARWLLLLGAPLTVVEPSALNDAFAELAAEVAAVAERSGRPS